MQVNHYECVVKTNTHTLTVNVFMHSDNKEMIKQQAINEAIQHLKVFGCED
ncbi:hypothetical protein [Pseudogracilibacillus sp. SO10305]|uniref:hypothetical protein n=1 Tax=Pseudogracilibacillus sp. SO10305 TaxID=3098292 RepID=UPI00300DDCFE